MGFQTLVNCNQPKVLACIIIRYILSGYVKNYKQIRQHRNLIGIQSGFVSEHSKFDVELKDHHHEKLF